MFVLEPCMAFLPNVIQYCHYCYEEQIQRENHDKCDKIAFIGFLLLLENVFRREEAHITMWIRLWCDLFIAEDASAEKHEAIFALKMREDRLANSVNCSSTTLSRQAGSSLERRDAIAEV